MKNIIFDFGGVLLDLDVPRSIKAISKLLGLESSSNPLPETITKVLLALETGKIDEKQFVTQLQQLSNGPKPSAKDIIHAWNAMLLGWDPRKFDFLLELRKSYNVYLLSNTNSIHLDWVYQDLAVNHGIIDFEERFFNQAYYSHIIQMRKPDREIFDYVLKNSKLNPSETLFIDDMHENVMAAISAGIQTYHHNPKQDLISIFQSDSFLFPRSDGSGPSHR